MSVQQYCLRWNNHQPNFISVFSSLLLTESLVDVTLAAEGRQLQAHKVVLSACSSYFQSLFTSNPCKHPIVILKDVQYNDLKTMVDFMYYGEVNVSTEQLPQILKTAEMLKIKGLAEMPDAASVTKSDSKSSEHTENQSGTDSLWGSTESQQQSQQAQQQQQLLSQYHHQIRRTPSPSCMSPATRRKRLRKTSTGSGSLANQSTSIERITDDGHHHQQQQQTSMDGINASNIHHIHQLETISSFSVTQGMGSAGTGNGRNIKSSPSSMQHQDSHQEQHHLDESTHLTEMKTEDLSCVNQNMPLDISSGTSSSQPASCPPTHPQHTGGQWAVIDTNYPRFALTSTTTSCPTSMTVQQQQQQHAGGHHHPTGQQNSDNQSISSGSSNSNPSNTIHSQPTTPVQQIQQQQYQNTAYSPQIITVNPNSLVNSYPPSISSTPTSPHADGVQSVYSQQNTPAQSPVNISNISSVSNVGVVQPQPQKRKRSVNPQGDENFLRALDAVRFGGIGFCKAARLYGVNNRTLWLEYKKRGYPISRPSIKNRIKTEPNMSPPPASSTPSAEENTMENYESIQPPALNMAVGGPSTEPSTPIMCPPHHGMNVLGFMDSRHVDFSAAGLQQMTHRQRYAEGNVNMNAGSVNLQGLNFNSM